jgi:hypothetical protein
VVDADTGKPIDGAVILDVFYLWPLRGFGNFPTPKVFRDSAQAVTDGEGRFTLSGPFDSGSSGSWYTDGLHIFKPGYGPWRFQGRNEVEPLKQAEEWSWRRQTWDRFTTSGVVIELRPLRTREERLKYIDRGWAAGDRLGAGFSRQTPFGLYFFDVPLDRLTDFQRAVDEERASLALPPRRLDGRRQPR